MNRKQRRASEASRAKQTRKATRQMRGRRSRSQLGSCFKATFKFLCKAAASGNMSPYEMAQQPDYQDLRIVHGAVIANASWEKGKQIVHSWIEHSLDPTGRTAIDPIWEIKQDADLYRMRAKLGYYVEYSLQEYLYLLHESKSYGPWDEELIRVIRGEYHTVPTRKAQ